MYGKMLRTFLSLFVLLCYRLPVKKWGAVMRNAKMSHDWSPDAGITWHSACALMHRPHLQTIILMYVVYFVFAGLSCISCLIFLHVLWYFIILFILVFNKIFSLYNLEFFLLQNKNPPWIKLLSLLTVIK